MRLGLFGGSFDPVHNGHLALAEACATQARLDAVWFVPAAVQPHKPGGPVASDADRVAMLRLAIADRPAWELTTREIDRGGVSYTVETLRELARERPEEELFFLMGADTLADLPNWREPEAVLRLATPLVVERAGEPPTDYAALASCATPERIAEITAQAIRMPPHALRSRELRERLAEGDSCAEAVPAAVANYALTHGVYR